MFNLGSTANSPEITLPVSGLMELDSYLMQLHELPKDLTLQLAKGGTNTIGGPKLSLDLAVGISDRIFMSETAKRKLAPGTVPIHKT